MRKKAVRLPDARKTNHLKNTSSGSKGVSSSNTRTCTVDGHNRYCGEGWPSNSGIVFAQTAESLSAYALLSGCRVPSFKVCDRV